MGVRIGIDVGGTFTDAALADGETIAVAKVRSTPADPATGFLAALGELTARVGVPPERIAYLAHGTTIATNAIVQGRLARVGLLTNRGFRDLLAIGTQMRRRVYDLWTPEPPPLVPRELCLEVAGRLGTDGSELEPLVADDVRRAARHLGEAGVEAVAVCFLHSYANPAHEREAGRLLEELLPGIPISLSSDVAPEYREYVRASTTALNAGLAPVAGAYIARLADETRRAGIRVPVHLMQSNGGVALAKHAARLPVALAASGPAAAVVGAARIAAAAGRPDVLTFDMGGTTLDVALVSRGRPALRPLGEHEGRPINVPQVDVVSIGAGGGSIARVDETGALRVGPLSAGAVPGPAAYAAGGEEPTVTDAHVVLGTIKTGPIAGGVELDDGPARAAIERHVARPLGLRVEEAAEAIVRVANAGMAGALRLVSVARGRDPRRFALVAAGGAGPMHACRVAEALGVGTVLVPSVPGICAAVGLLLTDVRHELRRTLVRDVSRLDPAELDRVVARLEHDARELLDGHGGGGEIGFSADLRYRGQAYNLTVPLSPRPVTARTIADAVSAFAAAHVEAYDYTPSVSDVELVTIRAHAVIPAAARLPEPGWGGAESAGFREVTAEGERRRYAVRARSGLGPGDRIAPETIVEQADATTVVPAGWRGEVRDHGTLILERAR